MPGIKDRITVHAALVTVLVACMAICAAGLWVGVHVSALLGAIYVIAGIAVGAFFVLALLSLRTLRRSAVCVDYRTKKTAPTDGESAGAGDQDDGDTQIMDSVPTSSDSSEDLGAGSTAGAGT